MSAFRLCLAGSLACLASFLWGAAPPPHLPIDRWVRELGDDEQDVWSKASDNLWAAGERAVPALRAALKDPDADVRLRATLLLGKIEWGILPDTPAEVVKLVEGYRAAGDDAGRDAAVTGLTRQGRGGLRALRRLLSRESDDGRRRKIAALLETLVRPQARDFIVSGDRDDAARALETAAAAGGDSALDYVAFLLAAGLAEERAAELEKRAENDREAARLSALLRRATGDLTAARRLAEKAGDKAMLEHLLAEDEDFAALYKSPPADLKDAPEALATLAHRAGDAKGFDAAMARLPKDEFGLAMVVQFFNGRPKAGIEACAKTGDLAGTLALLATQGRRREALALKPDEKLDASVLLFEQAALAHRLGDDEKSKQALAKAATAAAAAAERAAKDGKPADGLLAGRVKAGKALGKLDEALDEVGDLLDRLKVKAAPGDVLGELGDRDALVMLWTFLRRNDRELTAAATLKRLRDWFVTGKADRGFDDVMAEAKKFEVAKERAVEWELAQARAYAAVGKNAAAAEVYGRLAKQGKTPADHQRLGDHHFSLKQWADAAAAYDEALRLDATQPVASYLRGVALLRLGKQDEGRALVARARLLPLGDEAARYSLAEALTRHGLEAEALEEQAVLYRTSPFRSIYASNAAAALAEAAGNQKRYAEAARYHRRVMANILLGRGGAFVDVRAYLLVPGRAHHYQALAYLKDGKLTEAAAEAKHLWEYLPEETAVAADLARALDRAGRKADADAIFGEASKRLAKAAQDEPKSGEAHNRLAWLLARGGRDLADAVKAARRATELMPTSAEALDTLAEAHLQSGDKEAALKAIGRALELEPASSYLLGQKKRIEAGDPAAELPGR